MNRAFNNVVDMTQAITWDRARIYQEFLSMQNNMDQYGVINHAGTRASFEPVVNAIRNTQDVLLPAPMPVNYQGTIFNLETKYDLVGWIFSVTGPTPANSTVTNYFYPLTALYCHFCTMIATGKAKIPQMVQITWFTQAGVGRVNLGCNLDKVNTKNAVRQRRAQRLVDENLADNIDQTYSDSALPNRAGHCAETFPILFIRSIAGGTPQVLQNARGVAAKPLLVLSAERPNKLALPNAEDRQQILQDPCDDFCKHSIPRAGMTLDNFLVNNLPA